MPESSAVFMAGKTPWSASFGEDIYWQATTRGGRQVDRILAGKAEFKDNAVAVASVSLALADIAFDVAEFQAWDDHYEDDTDADEALAWGLGLAVLGIGAAPTAEATVPEADTRYWDNLPAHIDFITLPAGAMPTEVVFTDDYGTALGSQPARIRTDPKAAAASSTPAHASRQTSRPRRPTRGSAASGYSRTFSVRKCRPSRSSISITQRSRSAFRRLPIGSSTPASSSAASRSNSVGPSGLKAGA